MLEQMGGTQFRMWALSIHKTKKGKDVKKDLTEEEEDAGWDFITNKGELDKEKLKQMRWIHRWKKKDASPIKG